MSGHSKWSTIKRKKGAADAKRGTIFSKLIREISTAARMGGGDPDANPRLRLAMDKARTANMPKGNIERAIQKGTGAGEGTAFEEVSYEGYGPGGVAVLLETLTDNRNRTVGGVRRVFSKYGGNLGANGCVSYLFPSKGLIHFDRDGLDADALLEAALEAGAEDVIEQEEHVDVVTEPAAFTKIREALERLGFKAAAATIARRPTTLVTLSGREAETMLRLHDDLEDLDDVQNVYANFDIPDEEMAKFA